MSLESSVLEAVIEDRHDDAKRSIGAHFLDSELVEFYEKLGQTLDLVAAEAERRGLRV